MTAIHGDSPGAEAAGAGAEVLVVDDHPATRYATARVMRAAGFQVSEAATGSQGLDLADGRLAAIILDMHLPDINGFEVCQTLRGRPDTARVPVICLSAAYVKDDDKVHGLDAGADAYIVHPADPALLVATVKALMRARGAEEGMRRSEARFRAIYDHALCGICLVDTAGGFIDVNPAMLAMLQREKSEVVGRRVVDFAPPDLVGSIADYIGRSQQGMWQGDFPLLNAHGDIVHLAWSLSAHVEPGVSMAVVNDVSERHALFHQREQLLEREQAARAAAEQVSRAKDNFMAVLSHELRTPLNAILNWTQVLKHSPSADFGRGMDSIERNARIQTRLISDILDVSRMDLGKLRLQLDSIDAADVVGSAVSALSGSLSERSVEVLVDTSGVREPVVADAARLQQIVWNLLTNAIKFSEPGGRIHVELDQGESDFVLSVRDEGQGITPEFLPYLFDRFSQSDSASNRMHGGLGLGLSIVRHLVELHNGSVTASSAGAGQGATFVVRIPLRPPPGEGGLPDVEEHDEAQERDTRLADLAGLSVVAVEDDAEAREVLVMILRDRGARVRAASGYAEALEMVARSRPDVLLSDIGMAGSDGYALIREVRRRERAAASRRLPAIAVTAFARAQDRALAMEAGFDAHCAKPLQTGELIAAVLRLVRGESSPG